MVHTLYQLGMNMVELQYRHHLATRYIPTLYWLATILFQFSIGFSIIMQPSWYRLCTNFILNWYHLYLV